MSEQEHIDPIRTKYIDPDYDDPQKYSIYELINLIRLMRTESLSNKTKGELKKLQQGLEEVKILDHLRHLIVSEAEEDGSLNVNEELKKTLAKMAKPGNENLLQILNDIGFDYKVIYDQEKFPGFFTALDVKNEELLQEKLKKIGWKEGEEPTEEQLKQVNHKPLRELLSDIGLTENLTEFNDELQEKLFKDELQEKIIELASKPENGPIRELLHDHGILVLAKESYTKAEKDELIDAIRAKVEQKQMFNDMAFQTMTRLESEMDQTYQYLLSTNKTMHEALIRHARAMKGG